MENFKSNETTPIIRVSGLTSGAKLNLYESSTGCEESSFVSSLNSDGQFGDLEESLETSERFFFVELEYNGNKECRALSETFVHLQKPTLILNENKTQTDPRYPQFDAGDLFIDHPVELSLYKDSSCSSDKVSEVYNSLEPTTLGVNRSVSGLGVQTYYLKETYNGVWVCSDPATYSYSLSVSNLLITKDPIYWGQSPNGIRIEKVLDSSRVSLHKGGCNTDTESSITSDGYVYPRSTTTYSEEELFIKYTYGDRSDCSSIGSFYINIQPASLSLNEDLSQSNPLNPIFDVTSLWSDHNMKLTLHTDPVCNDDPVSSTVYSGGSNHSSISLLSEISDTALHSYYLKQSYRGISSCSRAVNYSYSLQASSLGLSYDEILYGQNPEGIRVSNIIEGGRVSLHKGSCSTIEDSFINQDGTLYPTPTSNNAEVDLYLKYVLGSNSDCIKLNTKYVNLTSGVLTLNEEQTRSNPLRPVFNASSLFSGKNVSLTLHEDSECLDTAVSGIVQSSDGEAQISLNTLVSDTREHLYYLKQSYQGTSTCSLPATYQYQISVSNLNLEYDDVFYGMNPDGVKVTHIISGGTVSLHKDSCSNEADDYIHSDGYIYPVADTTYTESQLYLKYRLASESDCVLLNSRYINLSRPLLSVNEELTSEDPRSPVFSATNLYSSHLVEVSLYSDPRCLGTPLSEPQTTSLGFATIRLSSPLEDASPYSFYVRQTYFGVTSCSHAVNYSYSVRVANLRIDAPEILWGENPSGIRVENIIQSGTVSLHKDSCNSVADSTISSDGYLYPLPSSSYAENILYLKYTVGAESDCLALSSKYINLLKPLISINTALTSQDPRVPVFSVSNLFSDHEIDLGLYEDSACLSSPISSQTLTGSSTTMSRGSSLLDAAEHSYYVKQGYLGVWVCSDPVTYSYPVNLSSLTISYPEYLYGPHPQGVSVTGMITGSSLSLHKGSCLAISDSTINTDGILYPVATSTFSEVDLYLKYSFDSRVDCQKLNTSYFDLHGSVTLQSLDVTEGENERLTISLLYPNVIEDLLVDVILTDENSSSTTYENYPIGGGDSPSINVDIPTSSLLYSRDISVGACFKYKGESNRFNNLRTFNVSTSSPLISISPISDVYYGNSVTVSGTVVDSLGASIKNHPLSIRVGNSTYNTTTNSSGYYTVTTDPLVVSGSTNVVVSMEYNRGENTKTESTSFTVLKISPTMSLSASDINWSETETLEVELPVDATGSVDFKIDGVSVGVQSIVEGISTISLNNLNAGTYEVSAIYSGDGKYSPATRSRSFSVEKLSTVLSVSEIASTRLDDSAVISGTLLDSKSRGVRSQSISVSIDGVIVGSTTTDSSGNYTYSYTTVSSGTHTAQLSYAGSSNYQSSAASRSFMVEKLDPGMNISVTDTLYGAVANVGINLPQDATGSVDLTVGETSWVALSINNGSVVKEIEGLEPGRYTVTASYSGDSKYLPDSASGSFSVGLIPTQISINTIEDIYVGDEVRISGRLTHGSSPVVGASLTISIDETNSHTVTTNASGIYSYSYRENEAGVHSLAISYSGDETYDGSNRSTSFNVLKLDPSISISADDIMYLEDEIITVNVDGDGVYNFDPSGSISLIVKKGNTQVFSGTNNLVDGRTIFEISELEAGEYSAEVSYSGDSNFNSGTATYSFNVSKAYSTITLSAIADTYVESLVNITGTLPLGLPAGQTIAISVGGSNYSTTTDGSGNFSYSYTPAAAGSYTVMASFSGNSNYSAISTSRTFNVSKIATTLSLNSIDDLDFGSVATISGILKHGSTPISGASVSIKVKGVSVGTATTNASGVYSYSYTTSASGSHSVVVNYAGSYKYIESQASGSFSVNKLDPEVVVSVADISYGSNETINVSLANDATGTINLTVGETSYNNLVVSSGTVTKTISGLATGSYSVTASYSGDSKYLSGSDTGSFSVGKMSTSLTLNSIAAVKFGSSATISGTLKHGSTPISGASVSIKVKGVSVGTATTNSSGVYSYSYTTSASGSHSVVVNYAGDSTYAASEVSGSFNVNKLTPIVSVVAEDIDYGANETITVSVPVDATGTVNLTVGQTTYSDLAINAGTVTKTLSGFSPGDYTVTANYSGDGKYLSGSNSVSFNVGKIPTSITINSIAAVNFGSSATISGTLKHGSTPISGASVSIKVKGVSVGSTTTNSSGVYSYSYTTSASGSHSVAVSYAGNSTYQPCNNSSSFTVNKLDPGVVLSVSDIVYGANETITVSLASDATGTINLTVGETTYNNLAISSGTVTKTISGLATGSYSVTASYSGDSKYLSGSDTGSFSVGKMSTSLTLNSIAAVNFGSIATISGTLKHSTTPISGATVSIKVKGVTVGSATTNSSGVYSYSYTTSASGSHSVVVNYAGNSTYTASEASGSFSVNKLTPSVSVAATDIDYGANETITVTVPVDATGSVSLTVGETTYNNLTITSGTVTKTLSGFSPGSYSVSATYSGNDKYLSGSDTTSFTVGKIPTSITINSIAAVNYGSSVTISGTLKHGSTPISGASVSISVKGVTVGTATTNSSGVYSRSYTTSASGSHAVTVSYAGNSTYQSCNNSSSFTVNKLDPGVLLSVSDIAYGENETITVSLASDTTGTINLTVGATSYNNLAISSGTVTKTISGLATGDYSVTASYAGDSKYLSGSDTKTFSVGKMSTNLTLNSIAAVNFGSAATISGTLKQGSNPISGATVSISVKGVNVGSATTNSSGVYSYSYTTSASGSHSVVVNYAGNSTYAASEASGSFTVNKLDPTIVVVTSDINYGQQETITITLPNDATGAIDMIVSDGMSDVVYFQSINAGVAQQILSGLSVGEYTVVANYNGDSKYLSGSNSASFSVDKLSTSLSLNSIADVSLGSTATISGTLKQGSNPINGATVSISVKGVSVGTTTTNASGSYSYSYTTQALGSHAVLVSYAGSSIYTSSSNSTSFDVITAVPNMVLTIDATYTTYSFVHYQATLPNDATGTVTFTLSGQNTSGVINLSNGVAGYGAGGLRDGTYTVTATYSGDGKYTSRTETANFTLSNRTTTNITDTYVLTNNLYLAGYLKSSSGTPITSSDVSISVCNNNRYTATTNSSGLFTQVISISGCETINICINYQGNATYSPSYTCSVPFKYIPEITMTLTNPNIYYGETENITVALPIDATGTVNLQVGQNTYSNLVLSNGSVSKAISGLDVGSYSVTATYSGDSKYISATQTGSFTVSQASTVLRFDSIASVSYGSNATISGTLKTSSNLPVPSATVSLTVQGNSYTVTTNASGEFSKSVTTSSVGTYSVSASYAGNSNYRSSSNSTSFTVSKAEPDLRVTSASQKYFTGPERFVVETTSNLSNPITITADNVSYSRSFTNGSASIAFNQMPGVYTVTVYYPGDDFYSEKTIEATVTVLSTIDMIDHLVKTYRDSNQFYATIYDGSGNPIPVGTDVTMFMNGVYYTKATNESGTIKLNINLEVGEYTIIVSNPVTGEQKTGLISVISHIVTSDMSVGVKQMMNGSGFTATIVDDSGSPVGSGVEVTFTVNGVSYTKTTDENGVAYLKVKLQRGTYSVTTSYGNESVTNTLTVTAQ